MSTTDSNPELEAIQIKKEKKGIYYGEYLQLDKILGAQEPESIKQSGEEAHEEMLFIVIHQAYELWFKLIMHELDSIQEIFAGNFVHSSELGIVVNRLERVVEIQRVLIAQMSILETMTPQSFMEFRSFLTPASGFQSVQFRVLENRLGLRPQDRRQYEKSDYKARFQDKDAEILKQSEEAESLVDSVERWLERTPFLEMGEFNFWESYTRGIKSMLEADKADIVSNELLDETEKEKELEHFTETEEFFEVLLDEEKHTDLVDRGARRLSHKATMAALLIFVYQRQPVFQTPFKFLSLLIDIDENMWKWRNAHAIMVHRMIGTKIGTGGSSGYHYLKATTKDSYRVFRDLFNMSTFLIPSEHVPELPKNLIRKWTDIEDDLHLEELNSSKGSIEADEEKKEE